MKIGNREIGPGHPCAIVAEISNAHNGSWDRALRLIAAARLAGADILKFQCYTPDELVALRGDGPAPEPWGAQGYTMRTLYEKARTPLEWFPKIAAHCERIGMPWFSSVFGPTSLAALEAVGCPALKVAHLDACSYPMQRILGRTHGQQIIVSADCLKSAQYGPYSGWLLTWSDAIEFVYCPGGYPAAASDMHLDALRETWIGSQTKFRWLGLSSHCMDPIVAPVAVARGARYLEYHFHLEAEPSELEANVSLNEREFRAMVDSVRRTEVLLG